MSLLGVDVGTTGCKAAAFSVDGRLLASAYREYPVLHPEPRWAELDSGRVIASIREVLAEAAGRVAATDRVTALCASSMGEAMTPVGRDRAPLGPSILSSDIRGIEYLDRWKRAIGPEALYAINPNILGPNYSAPKLMWIREHQPELYEKTDRFLLWGDMVGFLLGCDPVTGTSLANRTLLFDLRKGDWSDRLLGVSGIPRDKLPAVQPAGTVVGRVDPARGAALHLSGDVAVVLGGHDQCCNAFGAGIHRAGSAVCGIGSYECITPVYDRIPGIRSMRRHGLNIEHHVLPGLYVSFLYNQGGLLVRWFRDTFAAAEAKAADGRQDIYDMLAAEMPGEPTRLIALPYFDITGPPEFVTDASGVIAGLRMSTSRGEILKSIMECVTFYFVDSLDALRDMGICTSEFVATGGGAKSDAWLQIKADILGVPMVRPRVTEGSLAGAAMLAGLATGALPDPEAAVRRFVVREKVFEPDAGRHAIYCERLARYRRLFPLLRRFLADL